MIRAADEAERKPDLLPAPQDLPQTGFVSENGPSREKLCLSTRASQQTRRNTVSKTNKFGIILVFPQLEKNRRHHFRFNRRLLRRIHAS